MECQGRPVFPQELQQITALPSVAGRNDRGGFLEAHRDHPDSLPPTVRSHITEYNIGSQDTIFSKEQNENHLNLTSLMAN